MNYREVYYSRLHHLGETTGEVIRNGGIRSFEKWMAQSPFTINDLSVERGLYFSGIIEEKKDEKQLKTMYMHVANDIPVKVGDILNWRTDDGSIEKWLLLQEERKTNGTYRTFWIIRCNYLVKWVDNAGSVHQSWSYVVSSHNFIIEDEGWSLIEIDHTSVPGVIYLSLTESKVNFIYDDLTNDIADTDKIKFPELDSIYTIGDRILPHFIDDTFNIVNIIMTSSDTTVIDENMYAIGAGTATITIGLKDNPTITKQYELIVHEDATFSAAIEGADKIRLDRQEMYTLVGTQEYNGDVIFSVDNEELVSIMPREDTHKCLIHANKKNKLGSVVLSATLNGMTYTKTIQIIPLW